MGKKRKRYKVQRERKRDRSDTEGDCVKLEERKIQRENIKHRQAE